MLTAIPFFAGDKPQAIRLAEWIRDLGQLKSHDCLLAVYKDTDSAGVIEPLQEVFGRVAEFQITDDMENDRARYQYCANITWKRTALHIAEMGEPMPWMWLETDAVPLTPDWLDKIELEYRSAGQPFLLDLVVTPTSRHNSGVGVYPARVRDYTRRLWELVNDPWDVFLAPDFLPHTHHTGLIHDMFWLDKASETQPTFPTQESLSIIEPGAVIFHRNKDGSLIQRLRAKEKIAPLFDRKPWPENMGVTQVIDRENLEYKLSEEGSGRNPELLLAQALARIQELEAQLESLKSKPAHPKAIAKPANKGKKTLSPEHLEKLRAGRERARGAKLAAA